MPLTPNVGTGAVVQTTWGNAIRDRTIQVFASKAELDGGWPSPPNGARAHTTDTATDWARVAGVWVAYTWRQMLRAGVTVVTTDGSGGFSITHGLGVQPGWVMLTSQADGTPERVGMLLCIGKSSTIFSGRAWRTDTGVGLNAVSMTIGWTCGITEPAGAPRAVEPGELELELDVEDLPPFAVGLPIYDGVTSEQLYPGDPPVTPTEPDYET